MKKHFRSLIFATLVALAFVIPASASCVKIQSGNITDGGGTPISTGFDKWGYNYQARMFNGLFENFSRPVVPVTESNDNLQMKWSDDWLSNLDCNNDGKLDRGGSAGASANISKGWLTNHLEGDYLGGDGEMHHYTYFVKIVYDGGAACTANSPSCIWGVYTIIEEVYNDPYGGNNGVNRSLLRNPAGLGFYTN